MDKITYDKFVLMIGEQKSGMARDLMHRVRNNARCNPREIVVTGNEWSSELAQDVIQRPDPTETVLIYDDALFDMDDRTTRDLCMNCRHFSILFVMSTSQEIPPMVRSNCDYAFLFGEHDETKRRKLWKQYASIIPDYQLFCELFDKFTEDRGCMVIDNTQTECDISKCVYWHK